MIASDEEIAAARERQLQDDFATRERELAEERRRHEAETASLRQQSDERVAEQHLATETARKRAEVAERKLGDR